MNKFAFLALFVCLPALGQTDGPATLPQSTFETRLSFRTSQNYPKHVAATDNFLAVWKASVPGDKIIVDAGSSTSLTALTVLPNGVCTDGQYITVESADVAYLPDEKTRVTPAFSAHMPKIIMSTQNASLAGMGCTNLIGFEITRPAGSGVVYNLIRQLGNGFLSSHNYIHGTAGDETTRGIFLSDAAHIGIVDSYFSDFHCLSVSGACGDAQAIAGGASTQPDGDYVIRNNYIEASGEGILIGGGPATQTPCDMTIQYNDFNKPLSWNPADPSYAPITGKDGLPHAWIVKNNFELKNGCRVLFEGNSLGPVWGGFTQVGASILLTPKNAGNAAAPNGCPTCAVTDVTIRYNHASFESQAVQIGCSKSDFGMWPADCGRHSIHDNLFDHLQYSTCNGCGSFTALIGGGNPAGGVNLHDVSFVQNTLINDGWITHTNAPTNGNASNAASFLVAAAPITGQPNIHVDNNVFDPGVNGIESAGGGPLLNCWSTPGTLQQHVAQCWTAGTMVGNQFTNTVPFKGALPWPIGNGTNPNAGANQAAINAALAHRH
jgi:hypothetical protein